MWVYTRNDASLRLAMSRDEGYWIDYWLFLHAEETDRIWSCRPLGLRSLATLALNARLPTDRALLKSVCEDLESYRSLGHHLPTNLPDERATVSMTAPYWSREWVSWLVHAQETGFCEQFRKNLGLNLVTSVGSRPLAEVAFLSRRLASELADYRPSNRATLQLALRTVLRASPSEQIQTRLEQCIDIDEEDIDYNVRIPLLPTSISNRASAWRYHEKVSLELGDAPDYARQRRLLTGLNISVCAADPERATAQATKILRDVLLQLRLQHYVRTHPAGAAEVRRASADDSLTPISLPQPFWTPKPGRRGVATVPRTPYADEADRWNAARRHLALAISVWQEDVHFAASIVWQAIESFFRKRINGLGPELDRYVQCVPMKSLHYFVTCLNQQRHAYYTIGNARHAENWYYWNENNVDLLKWLGRVTHPYSTNHWSLWSDPGAPAVFFDTNVGLLQILGRHIRQVSQMHWLMPRLTTDLYYLYGLRNAQVHRGQSLGTDQWVSHLGRLGMEFLIFSMDDSIRSRTKAAEVAGRACREL